jgi:hypothetical protein
MLDLTGFFSRVRGDIEKMAEQVTPTTDCRPGKPVHSWSIGVGGQIRSG